MTEITEKDLNDMIEQGDQLERPVVVDFYAAWCGPCKIMTPVLEGLAEELEGIDFYKMDVDKNPEIIDGFDVTSVPSFLVVDGGRWEVFTGALPKLAFKNKLSSILGVEL